MREPAAQLVARLRTEWRMKLWLGAALVALFNAGYFGTQYLALREPASLQLTAVDRWCGFAPAWTWVYLSLYLLLPTAWLATTREQLWRYAAGMIAMALPAFAIFLVFPVVGPRPPIVGHDQMAGRGLYGWLVAIDRPVNSFPSLHVSLAVYAVCFAARVTGRGAAVFIASLAAWALLICVSTLMTKQHYFVDLPAGAALGVAADLLAWRLGLPARAARGARSAPTPIAEAAA
jgi:membrane-associated phospholipid phosphatase